MKHALCKRFYQYWQECKTSEAFPSLSLFSDQKMAEFEGCGLRYGLQHGDIYLEYLGDALRPMMPDASEGKPFSDMFSPAMKPTQMALIMPCFKQGMGLSRYSRCWFTHRHKDVEWILLPVQDEEKGTIALVGVSVSFVPADAKDKIEAGNILTERIITHDFLTFGQQFSMSAIDTQTWAVLDTMGARLCVDGAAVRGDLRNRLVGEAGLAAAKLAQPNVLAVAREGALDHIAERLGGRYNLKMVQTVADACDVLRKDMIDILVTLESYDDGSGQELIEEAQKISAFTACVMMLDPALTAEDSAQITEEKYVQHLVQPVGEFALRRVLDDANTHVEKRRRSDA